MANQKMTTARISEHTRDLIPDATDVLLQRAKWRGDRNAELSIPNLTHDEVLRIALLELIAHGVPTPKTNAQKLSEKLATLAAEVRALDQGK